jgi:chaperonin GroEL
MFYDHIKALQEDGSDVALNRAARLNTKTARYFVGAHSESALAYRRLKVEDAINAAFCALKDGIVAGGGVALVKVSEELSNEILKNALTKPYLQIIANSGRDINAFRGFDTLKNDYGYDSRTGKLVDMFDAGIIDPTDVVLNAAKNAIGVAASILTIGTVVTLPREEDGLASMVQKTMEKAIQR